MSVYRRLFPHSLSYISDSIAWGEKRPLQSRTGIHVFCLTVVGRSLWKQQESLYQLSTALGLDMRNPEKSLPMSSRRLAVLPKIAECALESILMPIIQMKMSRVTRKHLLEKRANQSGPEARRHCLPTVLSEMSKLLFFLRSNTADRGCHSRIVLKEQLGDDCEER